jgi:NAD(P)-dependent dehydrogenase (short-subunit alcohol dehydrogenase family)
MATAPLALITGAAKRIGRALAIELAEQGYRVAIHYRRSQRDAEALLGEIQAKGATAVGFKADLGDIAELFALVPDVVKRMGPISVLVNNASIFERDEVASANIESWDRHLDINLRAPFFLSQAFARQLPENAHGNIVNLIDSRVLKLSPHFTSYTVSKAGLWALTQMLAMALAPRIRVNAIGPGPVLPAAGQSQADFARALSATPLERGAAPQEIAAGLRFILQAPAMTGQMITLDGGQHLPRPKNRPYE